MKKVQRDEGDISVPGRGKDDRVIASGLACVAWHDFMRLRLASRNITRQKAERDVAPGKPVNATERTVMSYLQRVGLADANARQ
jgi:hypothetical protein